MNHPVVRCSAAVWRQSPRRDKESLLHISESHGALGGAPPHRRLEICSHGKGARGYAQVALEAHTDILGNNGGSGGPHM